MIFLHYMYMSSVNADCSESNQHEAEKKTKVEEGCEAKSTTGGKTEANGEFVTMKVGGVLPGLGHYNDHSSDSDSDSSDIDSDDLDQVERILTMRKSKKR